MLTTNPDFEAIASKYGVTAEYAEQVWYDTFEFICDEASAFNIADITEEELDSMKTNFVLPGFGYLRLNRRRVRNFRPSRIKSFNRNLFLGRNVKTTAQLRKDLRKKRIKMFYFPTL